MKGINRFLNIEDINSRKQNKEFQKEKTKIELYKSLNQNQGGLK